MSGTRSLVPFVLAACAALAPVLVPAGPRADDTSTKEPSAMSLGAFSVSLTVRDLAASRDFYEKLGFAVAGGEFEQNWLILRNGTTTIGLFQGMFERNMMTFNPGWGPQAQPLDGPFEDVRAIQARLQDRGLELTVTADPDSDGPAHLMLADPDGNPILLDQHVPKPGS